MANHKDDIDDKAIVSAVADSGELRAEITRLTQMIANKANASLTQRQTYPDYDTGEHTYQDGMPGGTVYARSNHAKYAEAKRNTLLRSLSGGGGGGGRRSEGKRERQARRRRAAPKRGAR